MTRAEISRRRVLFVRRYLLRLLGPPSVPAPSGWGAGEESTREEIRALRVLIGRQQAQIGDLRDELASVWGELNRAVEADGESGPITGSADGPPASDGARDTLEDLRQRLGCEVDADLLVNALTHRSYAFERRGIPNDRLEFLGDTVLGMLVSEILYRRQPTLPERRLAKIRADVLDSHTIGGVARSLELGRSVRLGRGEEATGGRDKTHILTGALEAIIGAVYLDRGLETASQLVHRLFDPLIDAASEHP